MPAGKFNRERAELFIPDGGTTLLHRVDTALRECPHLIGHHWLLEVRDGVVVVRGNVDSFFEKQMAQEALRRVHGIRELRNHLKVAA
jgi:osmotically-inducible protein OsmY